MKIKPSVILAFSIAAVTTVGLISAFHNPVKADGFGHENFTSSEVSTLAKHGVEVKPHLGTVSKTESDVLANAKQWVNDFGGTGINIQLVDFTKAGATVPDALAKKDAHIKNGKLENVPCYIVTIKNSNVHQHGKDNGHTGQLQSADRSPHDLNLVIDATTGDMMFGFAFGGPNS